MKLFPDLRWRALPVLALGLALLSGCSRQPSAAPALAEPPPLPEATLKALATVTSGRGVRAVWLEQAEPDQPLRRTLHGFGSADGLGVRDFSEAPADLTRPLLNADGSAIFYTRLHAVEEDGKFRYTPEILRQDWTGGPPRPVGPGMAVEVWQDPSDPRDYLYALETLLPGSPLRLTGEKLLRFHPDQPDDREIMWTETPVGGTQFQLSRDGRRAAGLFPFPKPGVANLETRELTALPAGAWPALAPDNSYASALLDGSRRRLRFLAPNLDPGWELTFMGASGWQDGGLLHPRWTNDPEILAFTGPYPEDAPAADICLVRFRDDLRVIQQVVRLTEGRKALEPDVQVDQGGRETTSLPQQPVVILRPEPRPWPVSRDDLVFAWDKAVLPLEDSTPGSLTPHGFAVTGRYSSLDLSGGWFEVDPGVAARISQACAASSAWSMEFTLTERQTPPPVSVRLAALMLDDGREAVAIYRVDRKLVLRILLGGRADRPALVYPVVLTHLSIEPDRPVHVVLALRNNRLSCWLDGAMQKDFQLDSAGLAAWGAGRLSLGDPQPYGSAWSGMLERIAIFSRALGDDEIREAAETAAQHLQPRTRPLRHKIKATLVSAPPASPESGNVRLGVSIWEVKQVLMGTVDSRRVAVAGWSRVNGIPVPSTLRAPGDSADLWLESWEDHPELEPIPRTEPVGSGDLPLYFEASPLTPPPPAP